MEQTEKNRRKSKHKKKPTSKNAPGGKNTLKRPMIDSKLTSPKPNKVVCLNERHLSQFSTAANHKNIKSELNNFIKHLKKLIIKEISKSLKKNGQSLDPKATKKFATNVDSLMNNLIKVVEDQQKRTNYLEKQVASLVKNKSDLKSKLANIENFMMSMDVMEDKIKSAGKNKNKSHQATAITNKQTSTSNKLEKKKLQRKKDVVSNSSGRAKGCDNTNSKRLPKLPKEFSINSLSDDDDELQSKQAVDIDLTKGLKKKKLKTNRKTPTNRIPSSSVTSKELVPIEASNLQVETSDSVEPANCKSCEELEVFKWEVENNTNADHPEEFYKKFLQQHKCLPTEAFCKRCGIKCRWISNKKRWLCSRQIKKVRCNYDVSEKSNTIFTGTQLKYEQLLAFFGEFTKEVFSVERALSKARICHSTMQLWWNRCIEVCTNTLDKEKIGGQGRTVEIDDTLLVVTNQVRRDKKPITCRMFGGVETENRKSFVVYLRDQEYDSCDDYYLHLESLIVKHVLPGTTICYKGEKKYYGNIVKFVRGSDGMRMGYSANTAAYRHLLDKLWEDLKGNFSRKGIQTSVVGSYITRYMFHRKYPRNTLHHFLLQIAASYPLPVRYPLLVK